MAEDRRRRPSAATQPAGRNPARGRRAGRRRQGARKRQRSTQAAPLSARDFGRFLWNLLTSMRTALVLLFALALAAIPGSLIPQSPNSPIRVSDFKAANPTLGAVYDALGLFDVYASPWFSAIYLLLFVSLIGCIIPRVITYVRSLRQPPPRTPKNLARLPGYASARLDGDPADVLARAAEYLRGKRFRVDERPAAKGVAASVAAERGYLREFGNLVFHVALLFVLAGVAVNALWGFKGDATVVEGQGFSNNQTQYDTFEAGPRFDRNSLQPFTMKLDEFRVSFETSANQRGAARQLQAAVRVDADGTETQRLLEVNHPISIHGTNVHLLGHGYAAVVTVRDGAGNVAFSGPVVFLPQDGNFTSMGVIKAWDARPQRLAFEGMFLPTATVDQTGPHSLFPDALSPELFLNAWSGPPRTETGKPENVFSLDKTGLTQVTKDGQPLALRMKPGDTTTLPNNLGSITFHGYSRWIKIQVSVNHGLPLALVAICVAIAGLCCSLYVRPRRMWARVSDGTVEVAGLDKVDSRGGLDEDVASLLASCTGPPGDDERPRRRSRGRPRVDADPEDSGDPGDPGDSEEEEPS